MGARYTCEMRPILAVVLVLLVAACSACGAVDHPSFGPSRADVIREEETRTVEILGLTPTGGYRCSGVIVSDHQVLTAAHCAREDAMITATRDDGTTTIFEIEVLVPGRDLARLETVPGWFGDAPAALRVGRVDLGARVCIAAAVPRKDHKCGEVQRVFGSVFYHSAVTEHGNSGAAVYDESGRIVGIVSTLYDAANGQIIGGGVGSLVGYEWLVQR